jgi:hypothetical protein
MITAVRFIACLLCLLSLANIQAQETPVGEENTDMTEQVQANDRSLNDMFNRQNPIPSLQGGGAFYVSNPPPAIELDPKIAYYRTESDTLVLKMMTGKTVELTGRYRIFDQKFEIKTAEGIFEMRSNLV